MNSKYPSYDIGSKVDYIQEGCPPLRCVVKKTMSYDNRNFIILEAEDLPIKSEIMVEESQIDSFIRKID